MSTESGSSALVPGERFVYERPRQRRRLCVASPDRPSILDVLPPETLLLILERLEWPEIVLLRAVNHRLKAIVERHSSLFRCVDFARCGALLRDAQLCRPIFALGDDTVSVSLRGCSGITSTGVASLSFFCPRLERLVLADCMHMTDAGIQALAHNCPKLRFLCLRGCPLLTDRAIDLLRALCPRLERLQLSVARLITPASLQRLRAATGCQVVLW